METTRSFLKDLFQNFLLLGILFFPFKWNLFGFHSEMINFLFFPLVRNLADALGIKLLLTDLSSDSKGLYLLMGILFLLAFISTFWIRYRSSESARRKFDAAVRTIISYFLALIILKYGLDKFMKTQFYLPEPNILYTPLGKLDKDILYWSTMGSSYTYNLFMGFAEIIPGLLLLIPRTRPLGALIAIGVLLNVLAINLSFDVSVKLFSFFLLMTAIFLAMPILRRILQTDGSLIRNSNDAPQNSYSPTIKIVLAVTLILIFAETLYPLFSTQTWNDDHAARPFLHGAYEAVDKNAEIKRIFVHRDGYLILQDQQENFTDLKLHIDQAKQTFQLQDYDLHQTTVPYSWNAGTGLLTLKIAGEDSEFRTTEWKELPLLKDQFHWTVD